LSGLPAYVPLEDAGGTGYGGGSMEHRWGIRFPADVAATLHLGDGAVVGARIANVSLSGALVLTDVKIPLFSQVTVQLELGRPGYLRSELARGYVSREARGGLGLEWNEFSPSAIEKLLSCVAATLAPDVEPNLQHNSRPHPSFGGGGFFERRFWR
jgi:PilZ domain